MHEAIDVGFAKCFTNYRFFVDIICYNYDMSMVEAFGYMKTPIWWNHFIYHSIHVGLESTIMHVIGVLL